MRNAESIAEPSIFEVDDQIARVITELGGLAPAAAALGVRDVETLRRWSISRPERRRALLARLRQARPAPARG